jgi:hypothetical protein
MSLVLETTPELDARLEKEAERRGVSVDALVNLLMDEMLEDMEDAADAQAIIHNTNPDEWRSLDDLRKAVRG